MDKAGNAVAFQWDKKKAFCETNDLGYYTFLRWTNRVPSGEQSEQNFADIATKPIAITAGPAMVELECCGVTLRVPTGIDERELSRLLRAAEDR